MCMCLAGGCLGLRARVAWHSAWLERPSGVIYSSEVRCPRNSRRRRSAPRRPPMARFHHPAVERDSATETLRIGVHHSRVLFCPIVLFDRGAEKLRRRTARSVERILAELRAAAMLMSSTVKVRVASCHSWALSPTHVVWNDPASRVARHEHHASLTRALPRVA